MERHFLLSHLPLEGIEHDGQHGGVGLREEQATHYMEYQQTQAIRARIHEAEQFYTRIRGLKHEMRAFAVGGHRA